MKHVARGRIVLWEGASLWAFDVPPEATIRRSTNFHAHHAIQLTLSVGGSFSFRIDAGVVEGPVVLIAPDVPHAYAPQGRNAMIFIEPESRIGAAALRDLAGRRSARLDPETFADIATRLDCIWKQPRPDDMSLVGLGRELAARLAGTDTAVPTVNTRIARVLDKLSRDLDSRMDLRRAAQHRLPLGKPVQPSLCRRGRAAVSHIPALAAAYGCGDRNCGGNQPDQRRA